MEMSNVPHTATVEAAVNAPLMVELFDDAGKSIRVFDRDVPYWMARGFREAKPDPAGAARELVALSDAFQRTVGAYDGSAAAHATMVAALREVELGFHALDRAHGATVEPEEGEPVKMLDDKGQPVQVDPGQVALYEAQGFMKVGDR